MAMLAWIMMGLAIWHFTIFLPDRFWGGIVGAFLGALLGAAVFGFIVNGFTVPGQDETHVLPGARGDPRRADRHRDRLLRGRPPGLRGARAVARRWQHAVSIVATSATPTAVISETTTWERFPTLWRELLDEVWGFVRGAGSRRAAT